MDEPNETDNKESDVNRQVDEVVGHVLGKADPNNEIESNQPLANMNSDPEKRAAGNADHEPEITSDQPLAHMNANPGDAKEAEDNDAHAS